MKLYEWIYAQLPSILGGCRPILLKSYFEKLGFRNLSSHFMLAGKLMPTEIVWGVKEDTSNHSGRMGGNNSGGKDSGLPLLAG